MKRKCLAVGIILLFIGTYCTSTFAQKIAVKPTLPSQKGQWFYVGGTGPGNYSNIYDAMDNASDGDTIFVYHGIYGSLTITKSLRIIGENKYSTILNGTGQPVHNGVGINANHVFLSGFTIQHGGKPFNEGAQGNGIDLQHRSNVIVSDCILRENYIGIMLWSNNVLLDNLTFIDRAGGISFWDGKNCTITHCIFNNSGISHNGFSTGGSLYIHDNIFVNDSIISMMTCFESNGNTTIEGNNFIRNTLAIRTTNCQGVNIIRNNFIGNTRDVEIRRKCFLWESLFYRNLTQNWKNNYWDNLIPKQRHALLGVWILYTGLIYPIPIFLLPYLEFDNDPAHQPYEIPGMR